MYPKNERSDSLLGDLDCLYEFMQVPTKDKLLKYYGLNNIRNPTSKIIERQLNDNFTKRLEFFMN